MTDGYRRGLRTVVGGAAIPHGYTLVIAASVGVLVRAHGAPGTGDAFAFIAGAAVGFAGVALAGGGGPEVHDLTQAVDRRWVGASSAVAAAIGLSLTAPAAHATHGAFAFALVGLIATVAYLIVSATGLTLIERPPARLREHWTSTSTPHNQEGLDVHSD